MNRLQRGAGKIVAVGASPAEFQFYVDLQVDLLFCGNDISCLRTGIQSALQQARRSGENRVLLRRTRRQSDYRH